MTTVDLAPGYVRRLHVDQAIIRANGKVADPAERRSPLTIQSSAGPRKAEEVRILDKDGEVVATLKYTPDKPLGCGARVYVETRCGLEIDVAEDVL